MNPLVLVILVFYPCIHSLPTTLYDDLVETTTIQPQVTNHDYITNPLSDLILNRYGSSSFINETEEIESFREPTGMEDPDLFQGDILSDFPTESKTAVRIFNLWPLGIIPYHMDITLLPMAGKIQLAMAEIESKTCIRFRPRILSRDYINMGSGSGCYSVIGKTGGGQVLSLGRGCDKHTTILHELLHAIGFEHMHSHRDRDIYLKIRWENIPRDKWRQFEVASLLGYKTILPFDYESVMLYGPRTFGQNGKVSMESKVDGKKVIEMSEKKGLSQGDIDGINKLYMCPGRSASLLGKWN